MADEVKICIGCNNLLPISFYEINKKRGNAYVRNKCRQCRLKRCQELRKAKQNSEKILSQNKICIRCNINKLSSEFHKYKLSPDGLSNVCCKCAKDARIKANNIKCSKVDNQVIHIICEKCKESKLSSNFKTTSKSTTGFYKICNSCRKPTTWNKEKQKASEKKYVLANPEKIREKWKKAAERPNRIIRERLNKRISGALKSVNNLKSNNTSYYVGCDLKYLKKWFEYQFTDNLGWHNKKEWHIDHVIPCSKFDLTNEEEQLKCFNWSNLRPCFSLENLEKGDKIIPELIEKHNNLVKEFMIINPLPNYPSDGDNGAK